MRKLSLTFAACSWWNERPKIQKSRDFNKFKMMTENEIKTWQTQSVKHKVAAVLIMDGTSFSYDEENGIVFTAPDFYVKNLVRRLTNVFGCSVKPIINEVK